MSQLEPDDSRIITGKPSKTPGEPARTGPREGETRGDRNSAEPDVKVSDEEARRWQVDKSQG